MLRYADSLNEQAAQEVVFFLGRRQEAKPSAICQMDGAADQMMAKKQKQTKATGTVNASKR